MYLYLDEGDCLPTEILFSGAFSFVVWGAQTGSSLSHSRGLCSGVQLRNENTGSIPASEAGLDEFWAVFKFISCDLSPCCLELALRWRPPIDLAGSW